MGFFLVFIVLGVFSVILQNNEEAELKRSTNDSKSVKEYLKRSKPSKRIKDNSSREIIFPEHVALFSNRQTIDDDNDLAAQWLRGEYDPNNQD